MSVQGAGDEACDEWMTNGSRLDQFVPGQLHYMLPRQVPAASVNRKEGAEGRVRKASPSSETLSRGLPSSSHVGRA